MAPVTVVEALPGFGKTTLVAEWARTRQRAGNAVVWLRASPDLAHAPTLLARVHEALLRAEVLHQIVPSMRDHDDRPGWVDELATSDVPVIVVIDDAHLLRDPATLDTLVELAALAHPVHLVACADTQHHVHVAARRHGLETNVLLGGDLSITAAELPAFASAWGHQLAPARAEVLHELVGGWLLPLRLVLDATPRWSDAFATHVTHEFLMDRVLRDTDDHELALAMRLAVPERIDLPLATILLDADGSSHPLHSDGKLAIASLERQGLLWRVPRNDGVPVWRYPVLVRRALLEHFEHSRPEEASAAHREVARSLAARGDAHASELLRHARTAGDWALLDRLWSERGWSLAGADPDAFAFGYARIPVAARQELGSLLVASSVADALAATAGDSDWMQRVEALLTRYMQAGSDFLRQSEKPKSPHELAEMLTAAMVARRTEGHLGDARRLAAGAERAFARARVSAPEHARSSQSAWFQLQSSITQLLGGRFNAALERATTSYQLSPNSLVGSGATGLLAAMHALSGQTGHTRQWLAAHDTIDVSGHWAAGLAQLPARIARAMLALDRLDATAAESELEALPLGAEASGLWPLIVTVHTRYALVFGDPVAMLSRIDHLSRVLARHLRHRTGIGRQVFDRCSVELMLALGEVNQANARLGESHDVPSWMVTPAARFQHMTGDARQAVRIAAAGAWRGDMHVRDQLQLLMIKSLALHDLGKHRESRASLQRAQAIAADTGNLEPFLLVPREIRAELLAAAGVRLDAVAAGLVSNGRPIYPARAELVQLSPRELEVLRQMRGHDTVAGLARSLNVSVNTVKKQLVSLYAKLDVHDRSSALLRAQRLGFIDGPGTDSSA
jgi:LuxR family maltose regulon positive regulatory protein